MSSVNQVEVFGLPNESALRSLGHSEPVVWNGVVSVKRYRITVEEVIEPVDVLRERLQGLLGKRGHIDNPAAIRAEARRLGVEL